MDATEPTVASKLPNYAFSVVPPGTWEMVKAHGFLTAEYMVSLSQLADQDKKKLLREKREKVECFDVPELGKVSLNDNMPIKVKTLEKQLGGENVGDFLKALSERVFFWPAACFRLQAGPSSRPNTGAARFTDTMLKKYDHVERIWVDLGLLHKESENKLELSEYNSGASPLYSGRATERGRSVGMWVRVNEWPLPSSKIYEIAHKGNIEPGVINTVVLLVQEVYQNQRVTVLHRSNDLSSCCGGK